MASSPNDPKLAPSNLEGVLLCDRYQIEEKVAHGGMAWVYKARHTQDGSLWALKILFPHHAENPSIRDRFLRESQIQHQLRHPHIVRVLDLIEERGIVGYAMEWCDGEDLRRLLVQANGILPLHYTASLFTGVLRGMAFAHKHGIIHRDLKPENILLSRREGTILPRVTDFGIAKVLEDTGHTETGSAIGTFSYMSPEQFLDAKNIDARSDLYSLGVILYLMVTGRLPFPFQMGNKGNFLETMLKVQHEAPAPPLEAPAPIQAIVMRCLEKEPSARYQSCEALESAFLEACRAADITPKLMPLSAYTNRPQSWHEQSTTQATPAPFHAHFPGQHTSQDTPLPTPDQFVPPFRQQGHPETQEALDAAGDGPTDHHKAYEPSQGESAWPDQDDAPTSFAEDGNTRGKWIAFFVLGLASVGVCVGLLMLFWEPSPQTPGQNKVNTGQSTLPPLVGLSSNPIKQVAPSTMMLKGRYQATCRRFATLLKRGAWEKAWRKRATLINKQPGIERSLCFVQALSVAFPLVASRQAGELLKQGSLNPIETQRAKDLQTYAAKLQAQQTKLLKRIKESLQPTASKQRSTAQLRRASVAFLQQKPSMAWVHHQFHTLRRELIQSRREWRTSQALHRAYLVGLASWEASGLWRWLKTWRPTLPDRDALHQEQTQLQQVHALYLLGTQLREAVEAGQIGLATRRYKRWQQAQAALQKPERKAHKQKLDHMLAKTLPLVPLLKKLNTTRKEAERLARRYRFSKARKIYDQLLSQIKEQQEDVLPAPIKTRWQKQLQKARRTMHRRLYNEGMRLFRNKKWGAAARKMRAYLRHFPRSSLAAQARAKRKRALFCQSSPPWICK